MPRKRYNDYNWRELLRPSATEDGLPEALPRRTRYGSIEAGRIGLIPVQDYPDILINPKDYKEIIADCHAKKIFSVYHQKASGVLDQGGNWNQGSLGYCWAFGMAMSLMDCRASENQKPVRLAPTSLGWLVNWRNQGNYLESAIEGAKTKGIASTAFVPELSINERNFKDGWEEDALRYRVLEVWDTNYSSESAMVQQCLSILATGRPGYVAYNFWGHALEVCAVEWDEKERNNLVWVLRNSHNETDVIEMVGQRAVPSEFFGVRAAIVSA